MTESTAAVATIENDFLDDTPEDIARRAIYQERRAQATEFIQAHYADRDIDSIAIPDFMLDKLPTEAARHSYREKLHSSHISTLAAVAAGCESRPFLAALSDAMRIGDTVDGGSRDPSVATELMEVVGESDDSAAAVERLAGIWAEEMSDPLGQGAKDTRPHDFTGAMHALWGTRVTPRPVIDQSVRDGIFEHALPGYRAIYAAEATDRKPLAALFRARILTNAMSWEQPEHVDGLIRLFNVAAQQQDHELGERFFDVTQRYMHNHQPRGEAVAALVSNVLPRMTAGDESVKVLIQGGNVFGMDHDDFGLADFVCHAYSREITPANLAELMSSLRELPTSNYTRLEANRVDALRLASTFGSLRDLIHDQRPGVHGVVAAMVDYYISKNPARLIAAMNKTDYLGPGQDHYRNLIVNLSNYDKMLDPYGNAPGQQEHVIDVLRRLEQNTRPVDETPPITDDARANELLDAVRASASTSVSAWDRRRAIAHATQYFNAKLTTMMDEHAVGIEPSTVNALAWLEQEQFKTLQAMTYEDQVGLAKQAWFQEVLRFHEITHNAAYDADEFAGFLESLRDKNDKTAAMRIAQRVTGQVHELATQYANRGKRLWVDALWSGNVTHELIGLIDSRRAVTAVGRRLLAEAR